VLPGESILNISGHCSDKACNFSIYPTSESYDLVASIPNPTPEKITFFISYDHYGVVKVHKDISEFHYKLWGDEWDKPLGSLKGSITLPVQNESEIQYWVHPTGYTQAANVEDNVLNLRTTEIPSNQWYEIRVAFPRIASPNPGLVKIDDEEGLTQIKSIENEYETQGSILKNIYYFTIAFAVLALAFPLFIYLKYGREPKIDYEAEYEREPPTDSKPALVNAIVIGEMGIPTMDGFTATVLDLANFGYISLSTFKSKESNEDILIEIINPDIYAEVNGKLHELEDFEKDAFNLLKSHASGGKVSWDKLKKELGSETDFYKFIKAWNKKVKAHAAVDKLFLSTGNEYVVRFGLVITVAAVFLFFMLPFFFPLDDFPIESHLILLLFLIIVFEVVLTIISLKFEKVLGCWTPEGRLYYERWNNFKKYLTDFSALKEYLRNQ